MGKIHRKSWMEDKDREKLIEIERKAIQDFYSNPNKFFKTSVLEGENGVTVHVEATVEFVRFIEDLRQVTKMIRKV